MQFIPRDMPPRSIWALEQAGVQPLLARLYAARGVQEAATLDASLAPHNNRAAREDTSPPPLEDG